jgi:hypothetical protein
MGGDSDPLIKYDYANKEFFHFEGEANNIDNQHDILSEFTDR